MVQDATQFGTLMSIFVTVRQLNDSVRSSYFGIQTALRSYSRHGEADLSRSNMFVSLHPRCFADAAPQLQLQMQLASLTPLIFSLSSQNSNSFARLHSTSSAKTPFPCNVGYRRDRGMQNAVGIVRTVLLCYSYKNIIANSLSSSCRETFVRRVVK